MPDKLVWIAKNEGWTSNRTRDLVDVSFTIIKESVDRHAELIVRSTYYSIAHFLDWDKFLGCFCV